MLALFDIDGTLVPHPSSEVRFARYLRRRGLLGGRQQLAYVWFLLRYFPRYGRAVLQKNKAYLTGLECRRVEAEAAAFAHAELIHTLCHPTRARLLAHQRRGDDVVLLSGTPDFIARPLGQILDVSHIVATRVSAHDGRFISAPPAFHPYGGQKLVCARELCQSFGVSLADTVAYADSGSDLPLLEAVGIPVAVRPRRQLNRAASRRGWEVLGQAAG